MRYLPQPYWHAIGLIAGDIKGGVVRDRRKDDATNRLSLRAQRDGASTGSAKRGQRAAVW